MADSNSKKPLESTPQPAKISAATPVGLSHCVYTSADLFRDTREILIIHRDKIYRLRITRQDKLILTK